MLARCDGDCIQATSIAPKDIPPGPTRRFSPITENGVPLITAPRSWWVSDAFCAIQFAQFWAIPWSCPLPQSAPSPLAPRSPFIASITPLPEPSQKETAGAGGGVNTGCGAGAGAGASGTGGAVGGAGGTVVVEVV